jgi:hypothetical protein
MQFFFIFKHAAEAMVTQAESESLNLFSRPDPRAKCKTEQ